MRDRIRGSPTDGSREGFDAKKQRMATLTERAKEFSELEHEIAARRLLKEPEEESKVATYNQILNEFSAQMPFISDSLADPALISHALTICKELIPSVKLGPRIAERLADHAMSLKSHIEQYPAEVGSVMTLMDEAHDVLADARMVRSAAKLKHAFNATGPALEILFGEANSPSRENVVYRILVLTKLLSLANEQNARWMRESIGRHIALCVANDWYLPNYTTANAAERLQRLAKRPSEEDEFKLTREFVETVLRVNDTAKNIRDILNAALMTFGLPKDLHKELDAEVEQADKSYLDAGLIRMLDQLEYIQDLEKLEMGAAAQMHLMFGIRWFSRYPKWLLKEQYEQRNEQRPYGVFFGASNDWNHKSFEENDTNLVQSMAAQLKEHGYALRVVEAASKHEMQERFKVLDTLYRHNTAQFLLLRAHSSKEGITLGAEGPDGEVYGKDLNTEGSEPLRECLAAGAPIILDGCAVGRRGGFAQVASEVFDTKVIAPPGNESALMQITLHNKGGRPDFDVRYEAEKANREVPPHIYISGRKR